MSTPSELDTRSSSSPAAHGASATRRPLALVTGASSGIGADLARELARDGHDLVLTARRVGPMEELARELETVGANVTIIPADLGRADGPAGLARELDARGLVVDVLVNNAGLGAQGRFDGMDPTRIHAMLQVNIVALTELTRLLLPPMVERRRGRVMLVASTASFQPGPNMAVYCATKAYVLSLGEAIAYELRGTGVTVTTVCPGATATGFMKAAEIEQLPLFHTPLNPMMSAAKVASIGYRGLKAGRRVVVTGFLNKIIAWSGRFAPRFMVLAIASSLMSDSVSQEGTKP